MEQFNHLKVALVHDFLTQFGGAERVLEVLSEMFPEAPIYTLLYDAEKMENRFSGKKIRTSFLQKLPKFIRQRQKYLLPLLPTAPETFDLRDFDLVISSSGAWSKGIVTRLNTTHISYMHSPMRFVWDANEEYLRQQGYWVWVNFLVRKMLSYIRIWDRVAADRPDYIIANSLYTQNRIKKYYGRESTVIYPPVSQVTYNTQHKTNTNKNYFLVVSRLSPYKNIDLIIKVFNKLNWPLVIVGTGSQENYLRKIAKDNVKIIGFQNDEEIVKLYQNARAFVFAGIDDFGIAPVEAMNHGLPIIALRKGGFCEVMNDEKMGEFFEEATLGEIIKSVKRFMAKETTYDRELIKKRAGEFSRERFERELGEFIDKLIQK